VRQISHLVVGRRRNRTTVPRQQLRIPENRPPSSAVGHVRAAPPKALPLFSKKEQGNLLENLQTLTNGVQGERVEVVQRLVSVEGSKTRV
jgi:hypothetical protein